jgi:hypothetical protein
MRTNQFAKIWYVPKCGAAEQLITKVDSGTPRLNFSGFGPRSGARRLREPGAGGRAEAADAPDAAGTLTAHGACRSRPGSGRPGERIPADPPGKPVGVRRRRSRTSRSFVAGPEVNKAVGRSLGHLPEFGEERHTGKQKPAG